MKAKYVIVGGGLAGATCAYLLQKAGEDVLLVERFGAKEKSKLCGGLMTPRSISAFERIFADEECSLQFKKFDRMRTDADKHIAMLHDLNMQSILRKDLDYFALECYLNAGGVLIDHCDIKRVDADHKLALGFHEGKPIEIEYEKLIAADGAVSAVRKSVTGKRPDVILTLEAEVEKVGDDVIMSYSPGRFGYCWYIPREDGANIGCGFFGETNLDAVLKEYAENMGVSYTERRGAMLPTGSDILLREGDVFFLGDAAGLICPPSGEGIYYAMASAERLVRCLLSGSSYTVAMSRLTKTITKQYKTRGLFFNAPFINSTLTLAEHTPYGNERAIKFALRTFAGFEC